jgi:hypothetical protein
VQAAALTLALRSAFVREEVPVISALTTRSAFALAPFGLVDGLRAFRLLRGTSSMIAASKAETVGCHSRIHSIRQWSIPIGRTDCGTFHQTRTVSHSEAIHCGDSVRAQALA